MGILSAVFANSGRIAFNIARIGHSVVEGRREKECQLIVVPCQIFVDRRHGALRADRLGLRAILTANEYRAACSYAGNWLEGERPALMGIAEDVQEAPADQKDALDPEFVEIEQI